MRYLVLYVGSVVSINYAFSFFPGLDLVWSCWVGLIFILRDMVQTRYGHWSLGAMVCALVLTYLLTSPFVAAASAGAFAASELVDWVVFTVTRRPLRDRLWLSSALSIPVDTLIFFGTLGIWLPSVITASAASKLTGISVVYLTLLLRGKCE